MTRPVLTAAAVTALTVLGARAAELDAVLAEVARDRGVVHLPMRFAAGLGPEQMAPDGFHPGPPIYRAWADAAHDALVGSAAGPGLADGAPR